MGNHYQVLGIKKNASSREIKLAYRQQLLRHHSDKGGDNEVCRQIIHAYETLSNIESRKLYDTLSFINKKRLPIIKRFSDYFSPSGLEIQDDVTIETHSPSILSILFESKIYSKIKSIKLNGIEIPNNRTLERCFSGGNPVTDDELNALSSEQKQLLRFMAHPLTLITSFMGIPNRLLDNATEQSLSNILKNIVGWQQNSGVKRKIINSFLALPTLTINLLSSLIRLPLNFLKIITCFLPKELWRLCEQKSKEQNSGWKKMGWNGLAYIALIISVFTDALFSPIASVRHIHALSAVRYSYGRNLRVSEANPSKKRRPLLWVHYFNQYTVYNMVAGLLLSAVPILNVGAIATSISLLPFVLPFIFVFYGPKICDKINALRNSWYASSDAEKSENNSQNNQNNTLYILSTLPSPERPEFQDSPVFSQRDAYSPENPSRTHHSSDEIEHEYKESFPEEDEDFATNIKMAFK